MKNDESNHNELLGKINALSESMGYKEGEKTVFEIKSTNNPDVKELVLQSGSWDDDKPMFAFDKDEQKKAYVFIPAKYFSQLLHALHASKEENFNLKLERTIWKYVPADFDDVWVVAMDRIKKLTQNRTKDQPININLDELISEIRKDHPNLFINLKDFAPVQITQ